MPASSTSLGEQDVSLALVGVLRLEHLEAAAGEPGGVRRGLVGPLGVAELHGEHLAVDDGGAVRGEDHVGQARQRIDQLDGVAQVEEGLAQVLPLADGQGVVVGRRRIHPRIDPVRDGEVRGLGT
nr:hypothetical protein GCM10020092_014390 [Actinoplanes digitatis]